MGMTQVQHLVTVDLDDSDARSTAVPGELDSVVGPLLETLDRSATPATFFASRSVAASAPELLDRIAASGHEVAALTTTRPSCRVPYCADFREHLRSTKSTIEAVTGGRVRGHRVTGLGLSWASEWVYDMLVDEGFEYDSSRFPSRHTEYGYAPVPPRVHAIRRWGGTLVEIPATTADLLAIRLQVGTASAVRAMPLAIWRRLLEIRLADGEPVVLHLRPGDLRRTNRLSFYPGSERRPAEDRRMLVRVAGILGASPFTSVANAFPALLRSAPVIES
jgi:peptidoglycan/xylan/chitin deacetylase (PgdA/CDA1 family)